jgi:transcription elongation factor Elf1
MKSNTTISKQLPTPKCPNCGRLMRQATTVKIKGRKYQASPGHYVCRCGQSFFRV